MAAAKKNLIQEVALDGDRFQVVEVVSEKTVSLETSRDRLMALLSKSDGEHASQIATLLGWQPHTLRAAISRLRRQGMQIATLRTAGAGGLVYALRSKIMTDTDAADGAVQ
ncbi:hypothetical protein CQ054_17985 [Ochrobactrum sp. MYb29]|nr:hypothetical protein CQ054_17985 [Ochrobactrum sp. MYb29]